MQSSVWTLAFRFNSLIDLGGLLEDVNMCNALKFQVGIRLTEKELKK